MEDFGHFGDEVGLFHEDDSYQESFWLDRPDDYNVFEERQLDLDRDAGEYEPPFGNEVEEDDELPLSPAERDDDPFPYF
jgi:hypothetical protein